MRNVNQFALVETALVSAVADDATFVVSYPSGTSQLTFNVGLAGAAHVLILDDNNRWPVGDPGFSVAFGASDITVTNLTGASIPAGTRVLLTLDMQDGNNLEVLTFPVTLANITGSQDVVTDFRPGIEGYIESVSWVQNIPVTTAAKLASLNLEIDTTNVTGGVIALTSAAATPMGKVIEGTAITALNRLEKESKLSIEASGVTAFSEGSGSVLVRIRRDMSNAI